LLKHKNSKKGASIDTRELVLQELKVKCFVREKGNRSEKLPVQGK
jgi:hypothetical protein